MLVYTANTCSIRNLNTDEALITPELAPGILDLPVVGETLNVCAAATSIDLVVAGGLLVPPLVDLEVVAGLRLRLGVGLGVGLGFRARAGINILLIGKADECDSVTEVCTTSITFLDNTAGVELEGGLTSIKGNREGLLLQLGLDLGD